MAAILEWQNANNQNTSYKTHSGKKLDQFQPMDLEIEILSFLCLCYFLVTAHGGHLDILKQLNAGIILTQIWSKSIKRLLRYYFHVLRCFL